MGNILFCITGPSGSGKTTVMRELMDNELVSITTRNMREGEQNGVDYLFISKEDYQDLFDAGQLAEWTEYDGQYYGLTMEELEDKLENGHAFFVCDNHGFNQIKERYDNTVSIFLYAEKDDCSGNMASRGDEDKKIAGRLSTYEQEIANRGQYDYVVKNHRGQFRRTVELVAFILNNEVRNFNEKKVANR